MITKPLEFVARQADSGRLTDVLRLVLALVLGCAVIVSQMGGPVILVTQTDTEAPVSQSESQDSEVNVSEVICVAVGRNRSLTRLIERSFHTIEAQLSTRLSALTALTLRERTTPDREFNRHHGVGAPLRC